MKKYACQSNNFFVITDDHTRPGVTDGKVLEKKEQFCHSTTSPASLSPSPPAARIGLGNISGTATATSGHTKILRIFNVNISN